MKDDAPSLTAYVVLKGLEAVSKCYAYPAWQHLVPQDALPYIRAFLKEGSSAGWIYKSISILPAYVAFLLAEKQINLGMPLHYATRKLLIEYNVRKAIKIGATQVVMISGGFDTLALRLHKEFPDIQFFETDHPATQKTKLRALTKMQNFKQGTNLHFLETDLSKYCLEDVLAQQPTYSSNHKTVCIAEGLMMYLTKEQADQTFKSVYKIGCEGSIFIFGVLTSSNLVINASNNNVAGILQFAAKEEYKFVLPHDGLTKFTFDHGFRLDAFSSYQDLQDSVGGRKSPKHLAIKGEDYCIATKIGNDFSKSSDSNVPAIEFEIIRNLDTRLT